MLLVSAGWAKAEPRLSVGTVRGFPGVTVTVPLHLKYATNDPINVVALQWDVVFDPALASSGPVAGGGALHGHLVKSRELGPGLKRVLIYALDNAVITNGTVAEMTFQVLSGVRENIRLTLSNVSLSQMDASALVTTVLPNATVVVSQVYREPSGVVDFYLSSKPDERYLIQATTNFVNWVNLSTNLATSSFLDLVDVDAPNYPHRFYRSALLDTLLRGQIGGFGRTQDGRVNFRLSGFEGRSYVIQASTNLAQWQNLSTNAAAGGMIQFTDNSATNYPQRFYRVQSEK